MVQFDPVNGVMNLGISEADKENILVGYNGVDLPSRLIVPGVLADLYLTSTESGDPMMKPLYKSTHPEYDGFPVWDNITLTPAAAFKWVPFCELVGIDIEELNTGIRCDVQKETAVGYPVTDIGSWDVTSGEIDVQFSVVYRTNQETGNKWPELQFISRA